MPIGDEIDLLAVVREYRVEVGIYVVGKVCQLAGLEIVHINIRLRRLDAGKDNVLSVVRPVDGKDSVKRHVDLFSVAGFNVHCDHGIASPSLRCKRDLFPVRRPGQTRRQQVELFEFACSLSVHNFVEDLSVDRRSQKDVEIVIPVGHEYDFVPLRRNGGASIVEIAEFCVVRDPFVCKILRFFPFGNIRPVGDLHFLFPAF